MTDQPQSSADIVELGAQALADDVWHPPVKLEQMARHEANKFRRQARLVIEAASSSDGEPSNGKQPLMASRPAPPVPSDQIPTDAQPEQVRNAALEEAAKLVETTGLRNPDNIARDIRCLAFQPTPAATVETKSAPGLGPSQNNAERLPSSDAAGSGAGTHLSVGTNQFETTKAGVIDWKIEAERANRLLAQAERPKCKLCGLEDGACICAHLPPQCSAATEREVIAQALCGADGNGFLQDCTDTQRRAYMIRADAVISVLPQGVITPDLMNGTTVASAGLLIHIYCDDFATRDALMAALSLSRPLSRGGNNG